MFADSGGEWVATVETPMLVAEERGHPHLRRLWLLKDAAAVGRDRRDGMRWPFACEDGVEQLEGLLNGPQARPDYYRYRLFDEGGRLVDCYLRGEGGLHLHLRGLPLGGERGLEGPATDLCVVFQRAVFPAAVLDLDELVGPREFGECSGDGDRGACGVKGTVLGL